MPDSENNNPGAKAKNTIRYREQSEDRRQDRRDKPGPHHG